jgi:hypothetical protein
VAFFGWPMLTSLKEFWCTNAFTDIAKKDSIL